MKKKIILMSFLSIVLISAILSVGYAQKIYPKFDGYIEGESTDEAAGNTTLHMKITASNHFAGQEVVIEWDSPPPGGEVNRTTVTLNATGDFEGDLGDLPGFDGVGKDNLVLKSKIGQVYDRQVGEWEYVESKKRVHVVGGIWVPVNKLSLLAPYIGLASTILVATVATAIYVKRRKKKQ